MNARLFHFRIVATVMLGLMACTRPEAPQPSRVDSNAAPVASQADADMQASPLVNRVWRVTAPATRAPGSMYVFLSDGRLLMTSCVETYRLATWTRESETRLTIVEDPITSYPAAIVEVSDRLLRLRLELKSENVDLTMEVPTVPYVCPDLRK